MRALKKLEITNYNNVACAKGKVNILGKKMEVCTFYTQGFLIDTGPIRKANSFFKFFNDKKIDKVLLTHHHEDHSGNASELYKNNIKIYANDKSIKYLSKKTKLPLYRKVFWGDRPGLSVSSLPGSIEFNNINVKVLSTPGHSPDHVSFYIPDSGSVFSGDVYVTEKTRMLYEKQNFYQTIRDIKKLLNCDFDTLFCSHAGIIRNGKKALQKKLENLEEEKIKILKLHKRGFTIKEIDRMLYKENKFISFVSRYEMSSRNLVKSVIYDN